MNRLIGWTGLIAGVLGIVVCLAALLATWVYYPRAVQKTELLHGQVDEILRQAGQRINAVEDRVRIANELTSSYQVDLREWALAEKQAPSHFGHRAEILATRIHQIQDGLKFAETLIRNAQKLTNTFRDSNEDAPLAKLLSDVTALNSSVSELVESAKKIGLEDKDPAIRQRIEEKIEQALSEVVHAINLFETADQRLKELDSRLKEVQNQVADAEQDVLNGLWWGRGGSTVYLLWMSIGQLALVGVAWRRRLKNLRPDTTEPYIEN